MIRKKNNRRKFFTFNQNYTYIRNKKEENKNATEIHA